MRRRSLLTALTAGTVGLAGCSFRWGPDDESVPPETTDDRPQPRTPPAETTTTRGTADGDASPTQIPGSRVADVAGGPRTVAVDPREMRYADRVRTTVGFATPVEGPTRLEVLVENTRNHEVVVDTERLPVVGQSVASLAAGDAQSPGLAFAPTENNDLAEDVPEVEQGPDGYWRVADEVREANPYPTRVRMDPGELIRADCHLVAFPGSTGWPTGTYRNRWAEGAVTLYVWHSERPGPTAPSRFGDRSVPPWSDDDTTATWYHEAGPGTTTYVTPETERIDLPGSVTFTAVNHSRETVGCGYWRLSKLVDGTYYDLTRNLRTGACRQLLPGQRSSYELVAFAGDAVRDPTVDGRVVGHLGGGTYAVVSGYAPQGETTGALVELNGPPVEVRPTDGVTARRDGSTTVVSDPRWSGSDADPGTATVTRVDETVDRSLIPEQVAQPWNRALQNTLPYFDDGVDRVVLRTSLDVLARAVEFGLADYRFAYRGDAYGMTVERGT